MPRFMQHTEKSAGQAPVAETLLALGEPLRAIFAIVRHLHRQDPRAARTFLQRTCPGDGRISRGFIIWDGWAKRHHVTAGMIRARYGGQFQRGPLYLRSHSGPGGCGR